MLAPELDTITDTLFGDENSPVGVPGFDPFGGTLHGIDDRLLILRSGKQARQLVSIKAVFFDHGCYKCGCAGMAPVLPRLRRHSGRRDAKGQ